MGVVVVDETRVGDPLLRMIQGHVLVPVWLVLGGLQGEGAAMARKFWPGGAECRGSRVHGRSIWEREEAIL